MALNLLKDRGTPLERQRFTWRELVQPPYSKLDDDAFTRVRVILLNGIESEALRFQHACARMNGDLQLPLARVRRVEQHQQTLVNWLNPPDQSPLETTIGFVRFAVFLPKSVGGAVEIAAITKHEGFRWVQRKSFYPAGIQQDG